MAEDELPFAAQLVHTTTYIKELIMPATPAVSTSVLARNMARDMVGQLIPFIRSPRESYCST
jgi:hypothetical protein